MPAAESEPLHDPRPGLDELDLRRTADEVRRRLFGIESEPVRLGRFRIDGLAGSGAMGLVHTAFDPLLQRRIALKVIRPSQGRARASTLLEEARSLARLTHPNVVPVYEVGTVDDEVFVAMELVEGTDLRGWLGQNGRSRSEVLAVIDQALAGLQAAHEAGLVHRDFKPDNVLLGDDGRVRVADFGLASALEPEPAEAGELSPRASVPAGPVAGTPAYMAPEVAAGVSATTASDQYSVGVTLFEALHGHRPDQAPREGAAASVPRWLQRVIERATAEDPAQRYPSLAELRAALRADPARRWRRLGGVGLVAVTIAGAYGLGQRSPERCTGARAELAEVWDPAARERVDHALRSIDLPYASATADRIVAHLDGYADQWVEHHTDACEATAVRGEQSTEAMDLRMGCLRRARLTLDAVAQQLERSDAEVLDAADLVLGGLLPLSRCADLEALSREGPLAPEALLARLAEAEATRMAGHYADAARALEAMEAEVDPDEHGSLLAEVQVELGRALDDSGRYDEAAAAFERALASGLRGRHDRPARVAASNLAHTYGTRLHRIDEALVYSKVAMGMLGPEPDPNAEAGVRSTLGVVYLASGRAAEAEQELRTALALELEALGPDDPNVATSHNSLGSALEEQSRYDDAEAEYRTVLEIRARVLGPDHPRVASVRANLGSVLRRVGRREEAEAELRTALASWERTLAPDHPNIASAQLNLGAVLYDLGELDEAERFLRKAQQNLSQRLGPEHPNVTACRINLSNVLVARGDYAAAEIEDRAVLSSLTASLGPEHPTVSVVRGNLGSTLRYLGRYDEAETELRAALELQERVLGPEHPDRARTHWELAKVLEGLGRPDEAVPELEVALESLREILGEDDREVRDLREALERLRPR